MSDPIAKLLGLALAGFLIWSWVILTRVKHWVRDLFLAFISCPRCIPSAFVSVQHDVPSALSQDDPSQFIDEVLF
jgi:hypothetical protein